MGTWFVIFNPVADHGQAAFYYKEIGELLDSCGYDVVLNVSQGHRHAIELTRGAVEQGYRNFMVFGGAGTLHEVVNGVMTQEYCPVDEIELAHVPMGTFNDWAKHYNIPQKFKTWIPQIRDAAVVHQDVGLVHYAYEGIQHKRYFINASGAAFPGLVARKIHESVDVFTQADMNRMILELALKLPKYDLELTFEEQVLQKEFVHLQLMIGDWISGSKMVDGLKRENGKFVLIKDAGDLSRMKFLRSLILLFRDKFLSSKYVVFTQTKDLKIRALSDNFPNYIHADGEFLGIGDAQYEIIPNAIKVRVPHK